MSDSPDSQSSAAPETLPRPVYHPTVFEFELKCSVNLPVALMLVLISYFISSLWALVLTTSLLSAWAASSAWAAFYLSLSWTKLWNMFFNKWLTTGHVCIASIFTIIGFYATHRTKARIMSIAKRVSPKRTTSLYKWMALFEIEMTCNACMLENKALVSKHFWFILAFFDEWSTIVLNVSSAFIQHVLNKLADKIDTMIRSSSL